MAGTGRKKLKWPISDSKSKSFYVVYISTKNGSHDKNGSTTEHKRTKCQQVGRDTSTKKISLLSLSFA